MSLSWSISHPSRLIFIVARAELQRSKFITLFQSIDAAKASNYRKLVDVTGLTHKLPAELLRELAGTVRQRERERIVGPIAIVASSAPSVRQATTFIETAQGERLIRSFLDRDEARRWLNSFYAFEHLALTAQ